MKGTLHHFRLTLTAQRRVRGAVFLGHWNEPGIALAALMLRLRKHWVFTMSCAGYVWTGLGRTDWFIGEEKNILSERIR